MQLYAAGAQGGSQGSQSGGYQQYMNKYAGGAQGGSQGKTQGGSQGSQSSDYQKYMKQYAGGAQGGSQGKTQGGSQGSQSGDYQKYMKQHAGGAQGGSQGGAQGGSQGSQSGDYQKYMKQYAGGAQGGAKGGNQSSPSGMQLYAGGAQECNTTAELDAWKSREVHNMKKYVPAAYSKYAEQNIDRQYKDRLAEIKHSKSNSTEDSDGTNQAILDLAATPEHQAHLNATQRKALKHAEVEHFREASEERIRNAQTLGESLKRAMADKEEIEKSAALPTQTVTDAFSKRSEALDRDIEELHRQAESRTFNATEHAEQVRQTEMEAKALKEDELHALKEAHREASKAAHHVAQGAQREARREAREVWANADRMARRDRSYQDLTNKLQNRVEDAANKVEDHSDELKQRTQEQLSHNLRKAKDEVHKEAERRFDALHQVQGWVDEQEVAEKKHSEAMSKSNNGKENAGSSTFLAQTLGMKSDVASPSTLAFAALVGVAFACLIFFVKLRARGRDVILPINTLG